MGSSIQNDLVAIFEHESDQCLHHLQVDQKQLRQGGRRPCGLRLPCKVIDGLFTIVFNQKIGLASDGRTTRCQCIMTGVLSGWSRNGSRLMCFGCHLQINLHDLQHANGGGLRYCTFLLSKCEGSLVKLQASWCRWRSNCLCPSTAMPGARTWLCRSRKSKERARLGLPQ